MLPVYWFYLQMFTIQRYRFISWGQPISGQKNCKQLFTMKSCCTAMKSQWKPGQFLTEMWKKFSHTKFTTDNNSQTIIIYIWYDILQFYVLTKYHHCLLTVMSVSKSDISSYKLTGIAACTTLQMHPVYSTCLTQQE